ncbi:MAG: hypothetical protein JNK74_22480 [Candidatus Hydrogenedentes bacterium]|nr:hypothetical protein [Candidatus Hydrogenedentota bacterium]
MTDDYDSQLQSAIHDPAVPKLYINGFVNSLSTGDIVVVGKCNEEPVVVINLSYTIAKSLAEKLSEVVSLLEKKTGREMLTADVVKASLEGDTE